jgi:hypothetical protein
MGVDYNYCGECKQCLHSDYFPDCRRENCGEEYEHPSGHGYYCVDCGLENGIFIGSLLKEKFFCNAKCKRLHKKEHAQYLIDREKELRKCAYCEKEQPKYKFQSLCNGNLFCSHSCSNSYDDREKQKIRKDIKMLHKVVSLK